MTQQEFVRWLEDNRIWVETKIVGDRLVIPGTLDLTNRKLPPFPRNMSVGFLELSGSNLKELPENLTVKELNVSKTKISKLPKSINVEWKIDASETNLTEIDLPNVSGLSKLNISKTKITKIADNVCPWGELNVSDSLMEELPNNINVIDLDISNTPMKNYPENGTIVGDLRAIGTNIPNIPENFKIEGKLIVVEAEERVRKENLNYKTIDRMQMDEEGYEINSVIKNETHDIDSFTENQEGMFLALDNEFESEADEFIEWLKMNQYDNKITINKDGIRIEGDLDLSKNREIKRPEQEFYKRNGKIHPIHQKEISLDPPKLPNNLTIIGTLDLRYLKQSKLPENLTIKEGYLDCSYSNIQSANETLNVEGDVDFSHSKMMKLAPNMTFNEGLFLNNTAFRNIPANLTVKADLDLRNTNIKTLPNNIQIGQHVILDDRKLTQNDILIENEDRKNQKLENTIETSKNPVKTVIKMDKITRETVKNNPNMLFVFGDNDERRGLGGQAKEMRGESNSIGIRTKKSPTMEPTAFYSDSELSENVLKVTEDMNMLRTRSQNYDGVVIPESGIGTGLAKLKENAPRTFEFLQNELKGFEINFNKNENQIQDKMEKTKNKGMEM